jgi:thymidylate synthase
MLQFESLNEAQRWLFRQTLTVGRTVSPRGSETLELPPSQLALRHPRRRLLTMPGRKWSLPLAIGELCWHLSASDEVDVLGFYSTRWRHFADDHRRIRGSCYGNSIFRLDQNGASQWSTVLNLLRADRASRRAVLLTARPLGIDALQSNDIACASLIQMLVRNERLDVVVFMRSNDIFWGFPYDVFFFTMLQELAAVELGLNIGTYHHVVGSLHLYNKHLSIAEQLMAERSDDIEMPALQDIGSLEQFLSFERLIRKDFAASFESLMSLPPYWRHLGEVLYRFALGKRQNLKEAPRISASSPYRELAERIK